MSNGIYWKPDRTVDLGVEPTYEYAFAADGKTYRTLFEVEHPNPVGDRTFEIREISTETGKTLSTLLKAEGDFRDYRLSPNGRRFVAEDQRDNITVWNVDKGKKESSPQRQAPNRWRRVAVKGISQATAAAPLLCSSPRIPATC